MQHQKYVEPRKNGMMDMTSNSLEASQGGNDTDPGEFGVANIYCNQCSQETPLCFFFIHDSMSITIKPININYI
jgi:hypothetical protein